MDSMAAFLEGPVHVYSDTYPLQFIEGHSGWHASKKFGLSSP